jgi:signal transduction histidine kinase
MVRSHPGVRGVDITLAGLSSVEAWVDARKLGRAIYNLLLNGCQAAKLGGPPASVKLVLHADDCVIRISIIDSGPGVPQSIRQTMFLPFVSEGKESGIGLGLTLAQQIAEEHGGQVVLGNTDEGSTVFTIVLHRDTLEEFGAVGERKTVHLPMA